MRIIIVAAIACLGSSGVSCQSAPVGPPPPDRAQNQALAARAKPPAQSTGPVSDSIDIADLRFEVEWLLREWELDAEHAWRVTRAGAIELCLRDECSAAGPYVTYPTLRAASAAIAAYAGTATEKTERFGADSFSGREALPRDIDKLFWSLAQASFKHGFKFDGWEQAPSADRDRQMDALIDRLAARYGLRRSGRFATHFAPADPDAHAVHKGDMYFGAFVDSAGTTWECGKNNGSSKYCCYVYCNSDSDSMAESH